MLFEINISALEVKVEQKLCRGPYHEEGKLLPITEFSLRKYPSGRIVRSSWCIHCSQYKKHKNKQPNHGYVSMEQVWWIFDELIRRVGHTEAARRINMSSNGLRLIKKRERRQVQKFTLARAISALRDARQKNEFRHRDSICHGAYLRDREEKEVKSGEERYSRSHAEENWKRRWANRRSGSETS